MESQFTEVSWLPCWEMAQQPLGLPTMMTLSSRLFHSPSQYGRGHRFPSLSVQMRSQRVYDVTFVRAHSTFMTDLRFRLRPLGSLSIALPMLWVSPFSGIIPRKGDTSHSWAVTWRHRARIFCGGGISLACGLTAFSILTESSLSPHSSGLHLHAKVMPPVLWRRSGAWPLTTDGSKVNIADSDYILFFYNFLFLS